MDRRFSFGYRIAIFAVLALLATIAKADDAVANGDAAAAAFLKSIVGTYTIEMAGGEAPHESDAVAEVEVDGDTGTITAPYCGHNGVCDPGYNDFPFKVTQLKTETDNSNPDVPSQVYRLNVKDGAKTLTYTWEPIGDKIYFRNYQYELTPGHLVTLEHVFRKSE